MLNLSQGMKNSKFRRPLILIFVFLCLLFVVSSLKKVNGINRIYTGLLTHLDTEIHNVKLSCFCKTVQSVLIN